MKITKQLKSFVNKINKELLTYEKEITMPSIKEMNRGFCVGIKDSLYLLGESYGEEYRYANGFRKFCTEIGINWELLNKL